MTDYLELQARCRRSLKTEQKIKTMDAPDLVEYIHGLEDEIERLIEPRPAGYVIVPSVPTRDMIIAGEYQICGKGTPYQRALNTYRVMTVKAQMS